jgi:SAM-dependent methyltransferase
MNKHLVRQHPLPPPAALERLWRDAMDPASVGMPEAIAAEIGAYRSEPPAVVLARMEAGKDDLRDLWNSQAIDPANARQVAAFYRDHFVEAYELANWHAGRTNGRPPLHYAVAAWVASRLKLRRALDFGSGIGTGSICLARAGCEVHSADIANELLRFVGYRLERRGHPAKLIDLTVSTPERDYYDIITCFDVLEHVPDQAAKLRELESYLKPDGLLFVNIFDDATEPDRPMHVSKAGNWLAMVRRTGLVPMWGWFSGQVQALAKTRFGRVRNALGATVDRFHGISRQ